MELAPIKNKRQVAGAIYQAIGAEKFAAMLIEQDTLPLLQFPDKPEAMSGITPEDARKAGLLYTVKIHGFQRDPNNTSKDNSVGDAIVIAETRDMVSVREVAKTLGMTQRHESRR